ncbi:hypothetical protein NVV94_07055 [Pseudomonas sp. LS1212]|nr:hypothetical protein [Pseudomonas sp. LS1212]UVJ46697.1 hypothetical protein NVV94_07055 [Pseudomonas sp. LS1212]
MTIISTFAACPRLMMRRPLSCLLLLLLPLTLHAAEMNPPKVGLVLSGGAARGLAHIGVLKALEEQGVKMYLNLGQTF